MIHILRSQGITKSQHITHNTEVVREEMSIRHGPQLECDFRYVSIEAQSPE